jgi:hypothetical protein
MDKDCYPFFSIILGALQQVGSEEYTKNNKKKHSGRADWFIIKK